MATREEKLRTIECLKTEVAELKDEIEKQERRRFAIGSLVRSGIVLLIIAAGIYFIGRFLV